MSCQLLRTSRFVDHRGYFSETYNRRRYSEYGIDVEFVQDNHSLSVVPGTLRGLHFQSPPFAQGKLVRCSRGAIFDVAVDIRRGSPTFGFWEGFQLTAEGGDQLYIPIGYAHGFLTLEPDTEVIYKCTEYYSPGFEGAVRWDSCGIDWPLSNRPLLSDKDANAQAFIDFNSPFIYGENI